MLKIMRRLLETRFEPNMKKKAQKLREHTNKNRKKWNRRIRAVECGQVETERRKIYWKLWEDKKTQKKTRRLGNYWEEYSRSKTGKLE